MGYQHRPHIFQRPNSFFVLLTIQGRYDQSAVQLESDLVHIIPNPSDMADQMLHELSCLGLLESRRRLGLIEQSGTDI